MTPLPEIILDRLAIVSGITKHSIQFTGIGGGSINDTFRVKAGATLFFCKINSASKFPQLFLKEKNGLEAIALSQCIRTPAVIDHGEAGPWQYLILENIEEDKRTRAFWQLLGAQLAALHRHTAATFGWMEDNYMGAVLQKNTLTKNWIDFLVLNRLQPMVQHCLGKNLLQAKHLKAFERVYKELFNIFAADETPALLHGDLWSGNFMCGHKSNPVLIDPAVYFGHRSMDLAMTSLFGGFHQDFYNSYNDHFPFPLHYKEQWEVCNLYPLLIHLYLFGTGYLSQVEDKLAPFHH